MLQKFFPISYKAKDITGLIIALIIYLVAPTVFGWVASLLSGVPIIGLLLGLVVSLAGIYCLIGIILAVLVILGIVK